MRHKFSDHGTLAGVAIQASPYRNKEFRRKICGQGDALRALSGPCRRSLSERLDQRDAESPNVARGGYPAVPGLRRVVQRRLGCACGGLAGGSDHVARQLQLIIDDQKVWRLEPAVHQLPAVEIRQGAKGCRQKFPHLAGSQGPAGKYLPEMLIRIIHHDEEKVVSPELTAARVEKADQVRVRQCGNRPPVLELRLRQRRVGRHDLDRGLGNVSRLAFGEKDRAVVRSSQKAAQRIHSVDNPALPLLRPVFSHRHQKISPPRGE